MDREQLKLRFFLGFLFFFLYSALAVPFVMAEWIIAEGSYEVENADVGTAKKMALHDAERNAVERVLGAMVESETLVENFVLIKDKIMTRVDGYVKHIEILEEKCNSNLCKVKIKADVESRDLADDVAALARILPKMNYPTMAVFIDLTGLTHELRPVSADLSRVVEDRLTALFKAKGFILVEEKSIKREQKRQSNGSIPCLSHYLCLLNLECL